MTFPVGTRTREDCLSFETSLLWAAVTTACSGLPPSRWDELKYVCYKMTESQISKAGHAMSSAT